MGMALPRALLLGGAAALILAFGHVVSWVMESRAIDRRTLWRIVLVATSLLSLGPLILFAAGTIDELTRGMSPARPLGLFVIAALIPALAYWKFRNERMTAGARAMRG